MTNEGDAQLLQATATQATADVIEANFHPINRTLLTVLTKTKALPQQAT